MINLFELPHKAKYVAQQTVNIHKRLQRELKSLPHASKLSSILIYYLLISVTSQRVTYINCINSILMQKILPRVTGSENYIRAASRPSEQLIKLLYRIIDSHCCQVLKEFFFYSPLRLPAYISSGARSSKHDSWCSDPLVLLELILHAER